MNDTWTNFKTNIDTQEWMAYLLGTPLCLLMPPTAREATWILYKIYPLDEPKFRKIQAVLRTSK